MEERKSRTAKTQNAGTVFVSKSESGIKLYPHQENAFVQMTKKIADSHKYPYKGLLVLPTGGGKTLTAARWISENIIDKGIKVLWIAHRHELLVQAKRTFTEILAHSDVFPNRESFNYRIISGIHDKPVNIKSTDDILFASKDSLNESGFNHLKENWLKDTNEIFFVIDEAHHASARTYRKLIDNLENCVSKFRMLGLTATPFRTRDNEQGYLHKIFPDDMVFEISLRSLIRQGILSEPKFEEVKTDIDLTQDLDAEQIKKINEGFDIESIGEGVAKKIADNTERNNLIVNRYIENKEKYGKTIVFAVNVSNALALNALFNEKGIRSDYVMSDVRDKLGLHNISAKENPEKIARFRKGGDLDVLINVNILTEGTDVPDVQSVFLTRPTSSKIMMTQMMGRGLRGEKAGGTKDAYIVTFIDQWNENIAWVNPEKLYIDELDFNDLDSETRKYIVRLIAISKIEEFAILSDRKIDPKKKALLESIDFIKRIPKGVYQFRYPAYKENGEPYEKVCEILVYDNLENAYNRLMDNIPQRFNSIRDEIEAPENIRDSEIINYSDDCINEYFSDVEPYPAFRPEDIDDLLRYYFITGDLPKYFVFPDREKYDIATIANYIIDNNLDRKGEAEYVGNKWKSEAEGWQTFFDFSEKNFRREIELAIERILHPEDYIIQPEKPHEIFEDRRFEDMSLVEIREHDFEYYNWLRNKVFERFTDADGFYYSAKSQFKSKNPNAFEIDHINPRENGGKTILENLQLLTIKENRKKGANYNPTMPLEVSSSEISISEDSETPQKSSFRICRADGTILEKATDAETFVAAIKEVGVERVKALNLKCGNEPLISNQRSAKYAQSEVGDNLYVLLHSSGYMQIILTEISDRLNLNWLVDDSNIEITDDVMSGYEKNMKTLILVVEPEELKEIAEGRKKEFDVELLPENSGLLAEIDDESYIINGDEQEGEAVIAKKYDAIRFYDDYTKNSNTALVKIEKITSSFMRTEDGFIIYEGMPNEKDYWPYTMIKYHLGGVVEKNC